MASATVTSKGQVTIPADIREAFGIKPGDKLEFTPVSEKRMEITVRNATWDELFAFFDTLPRNPTGETTDEEAVGRWLGERDDSTKSAKMAGETDAAA